jgi:hypothetical protein
MLDVLAERGRQALVADVADQQGDDRVGLLHRREAGRRIRRDPRRPRARARGRGGGRGGPVAGAAVAGRAQPGADQAGEGAEQEARRQRGQQQGRASAPALAPAGLDPPGVDGGGQVPRPGVRRPQHQGAGGGLRGDLGGRSPRQASTAARAGRAGPGRGIEWGDRPEDFGPRAWLGSLGGYRGLTPQRRNRSYVSIEEDDRTSRSGQVVPSTEMRLRNRLRQVR